MSFKTPDLLDNNEDKVRDGSLRVVAPMFQSYGGRPEFSGQIVTLKLFEDNSLVRELLAGSGDGKVLLIDGGGSLRCALLGDQLAALALANGWSGLVINGCVRDVQALASIDLGVQALGAHPRKTGKRGLGDVDVAVEFAGLQFRPGDWLHADANGVLISDRALVAG